MKNIFRNQSGFFLFENTNKKTKKKIGNSQRDSRLIRNFLAIKKMKLIPRLRPQQWSFSIVLSIDELKSCRMDLLSLIDLFHWYTEV